MLRLPVYPPATSRHTLHRVYACPGSPSVHAELVSLFFDGMHKRLCVELTALVGIHHLQPAMTRERLVQHLDRMTDLQRDGDLRGQHRTAGPIHDGGARDEPFGHWDVGRIECPHLVGAVDGEPAQQITSVRLKIKQNHLVIGWWCNGSGCVRLQGA